MSFSDRPGLTIWQKVGCGIYLVFALIASCVFFWLGFFGLMVQPSNILALTILSGGPIFLLFGGYLLMKFFKREKS